MEDISQFYTPDQLSEIMDFLKLNEHNLEDIRSLEIELTDRFDYIEDPDYIPPLIDYYYTQNHGNRTLSTSSRSS